MMRTLYRGLASARLTLFLFLILAVTSIFGTLVQQGLPRQHYVEVYGPTLSSLLEFFHIFDLYHSWWFTGLLLLLAVNIAACTARQIPRLFRQIFSGDRHGDDGVFQTAPIRRTLRSLNSVDEMRRQARILLRSLAGEPTMTCREENTCLYAERGRYARLGMIGIHISVLLILAGGLIGSIWGFSGQMRIDEGTSSNTVKLFGSDQTRILPFAIGCDDFSVSFYENGMPKEYRSDVTVLEGGKKVLSATIRVNEPLTYKGLKFCQATYGIAEASSFRVVAKDIGTGREVPLILDLMKKVPLPDTVASFAVGRFSSDFQGHGPALLGVLIRPGKEHDIFWILRDNKGHKAEPHGGYTFDFQDFDTRFYTGIQVGSDPGVPLVWVGFVLILTGFTLSLLGAHRRIWVKITPVSEGGEILIAADAGKNRKGFEERLDEACRKIFTE